MRRRTPIPGPDDARTARPPGSPARRTRSRALDAFARGMLPLGDRPAGAPAGRGVRVFVVEYGVAPACAHARRGGACRERGLRSDGGWPDEVGDGAAMTAAIRHVAPAAEVFAVKIFGQGVAATADVLEGALAFARRSRARVVALRVPAAHPEHGGRVRALCREAAEDGLILVAPAPGGPARRAVAAAPREVIGTVADRRLGDGTMRYVRGAPFECRAGGWPRPHAALPPPRRFSAHGFAAARVSGAVACILEARPRADLAAVRAELEAHFGDRWPRVEEELS